MDPLTELCWEDRWGRLAWVVAASGKNIETSVCSRSGFCCHSHVRDPQCCAKKMNDSTLGETRTNGASVGKGCLGNQCRRGVCNRLRPMLCLIYALQASF